MWFMHIIIIIRQQRKRNIIHNAQVAYITILYIKHRHYHFPNLTSEAENSLGFFISFSAKIHNRVGMVTTCAVSTVTIKTMDLTVFHLAHSFILICHGSLQLPCFAYCPFVFAHYIWAMRLPDPAQVAKFHRFMYAATQCNPSQKKALTRHGYVNRRQWNMYVCTCFIDGNNGIGYVHRINKNNVKMFCCLPPTQHTVSFSHHLMEFDDKSIFFFACSLFLSFILYLWIQCMHFYVSYSTF